MMLRSGQFGLVPPGFVQLSIVSAEMITEPAFEVVGKLLLVKRAVILDLVHDVTQVIKQRLVILLVLGECGVARSRIIFSSSAKWAAIWAYISPSDSSTWS